jgi:WD40 repeat protein
MLFNFFTINQKYFSLTGARDRQIVLWDLSTNWVCVPIEKAHDGWIWSISCPKYNVYTFFSAGWDSTVKKWQITEASIRPIQKINVNTAALSCIAENENIFYVSTFRGGPLLYDTRMACTSPIASNNCHGQKPVFELATKSNSNQIFSIGDDNKLVALDKRRFESLTGSYQSMGSISHVDYEDKQLCLSLKSGHFLFFDPETLQLENELNIFNDDGTPFNGDQNIRISRGATFCACSDSSLHVFSPGIQPQQIARIKLGGNITRMDVLDEHMVATTTIDKLHYWPNIESIN